MGDSFNSSGDYRIEISGWGIDNDFFVEKTDLRWTASGEKHVQLRHALQGGAIVFVRLLASEVSSGSIPVAYQVRNVMPMDCNGYSRMTLAQLRRRSKESMVGKRASNWLKRSRRGCSTKNGEKELQSEEIL